MAPLLVEVAGNVVLKNVVRVSNLIPGVTFGIDDDSSGGSQTALGHGIYRGTDTAPDVILLAFRCLVLDCHVHDQGNRRSRQDRVLQVVLIQETCAPRAVLDPEDQNKTS